MLALAVDHNGWVWFQGGDQIWLSTQGWLLGQLELPPTELGYLWSYALTPIMWVTGPTYVQALPPLVVLQVLVLGPVALLCVYDLAAGSAGACSATGRRSCGRSRRSPRSRCSSTATRSGSASSSSRRRSG